MNSPRIVIRRTTYLMPMGDNMTWDMKPTIACICHFQRQHFLTKAESYIGRFIYFEANVIVAGQP